MVGAIFKIHKIINLFFKKSFVSKHRILIILIILNVFENLFPIQIS